MICSVFRGICNDVHDQMHWLSSTTSVFRGLIVCLWALCVTYVELSSPGLYLKPVWYLLEEHSELLLFFFLNNPPPPEFSPLPHHAPLPISPRPSPGGRRLAAGPVRDPQRPPAPPGDRPLPCRRVGRVGSPGLGGAQPPPDEPLQQREHP